MIIVDVFEPVLVENLINGKIPCERKSLKQGDYKFIGSNNEVVLIERKSVNDLYSSLISGRVNKQLMRCLAETPNTFLLIEGKLKELHGFLVTGNGRKSKYPFTGLSNFLTTVQSQGVRLLLSTDMESTARVVVSAYSWFQRTDHTAMLRVNKRGITNQPTLHGKQVALLCNLPGIGKGHAEEILKVYPSPRAAIIGSFGGVKGLGEARLKELKELLG
jgi:ERCC4-type nuclease